MEGVFINEPLWTCFFLKESIRFVILYNIYDYEK